MHRFYLSRKETKEEEEEREKGREKEMKRKGQTHVGKCRNEIENE
jgi:hypothetical protein